MAENCKKENPFAECKYKIILLGEPDVGKTTLALRIKHGVFIDTRTMEDTREDDSVRYTTTVDGEDITVGLVLCNIELSKVLY